LAPVASAHIGNKKDNRWHLQLAQRWVLQYNFYLNDRHWGRMFVRASPYFPFSVRVCLNQHHWLARRMQQKNIDFQQTSATASYPTAIASAWFF
jgi:hypothetical protein